ncbi:MAG: heme-binding protein [Clostridia bacterium]|nr:heme-binding protein [Clostridia bacterium]
MDDKLIRKIVDNVVSEYRKRTDGAAPDRSVSVGNITLSRALELCEAVKAEAARTGVRAVVCVSDRGGHPILVECMDDAYIASYDVAVNKAFTVVALKMSTSKLKPLAQPGGSLYGIQFTNSGKIVIFGGGEPLADLEGNIIGGLGVSGGSEEQDTALAAYGRKYFEGV